MTAAPNLIRALFAAAVCIAAFAMWTPASLGQVVEPPPPAAGDGGPAGDPVPPADPPVVVENPPVDPPVVPEAPADPPVVVDSPADPPIVVPEPTVAEQPADRPAAREGNDSRWETSRQPADVVTQTTPSAATPSDIVAEPAPLPPAGAGDDFGWTEKGDAFVYESGGSGGSGDTAVLGSFTRFGSIATAAARIPSLGGRERAARRAAQANTSGSGLVLVDSTGNTMLFFKLFGGGGDGGAALVMLTALGLLTVFRMMPPDWTGAFRSSTAVWRPSAYIPPIERPG